MRLHEISSEIELLHSQAAFDAEMAAVTGDSKWSAAYDATTAKIYATMVEAVRIGPPSFAEALDDLTGIRDKLQDMARQVLDMSKAGRTAEAGALINSVEFLRLSQEYKAGIIKARNILLRQEANQLQRMRSISWWGVVLSALAGVVLAILWIYAIVFVRRYFSASEHARKDLEKSSTMLEKMVAERAEELQKTNIRLRAQVKSTKAVEKALRQSEQNYHSIFDSVNDAILVFDKDSSEIIELNRRAEEMFETTREDMLGSLVTDFSVDVGGPIDQIVRERHIAAINGTPQFFEWLSKSRLGRVFWTDISLQSTLFRGDHHIVGVIRDIDEKKRDQEHLRAQEHIQKLFLDHAPAAIAMLDHDMRFISCSRAWLDNFSLTPGQLLGAKMYDLLPFLPESWAEVHRRCLEGQVERRDEESFFGPTGRLEWSRWEARPWYKDDSEVGGTIMFVELITDRKLQEDQLDLAYKIFDNAVEGVMVTNADGFIEMVNRGFTVITGYMPEEVLGKNPRILRSDRHGPDFYAGMWHSLREHGEWSGEIWNRRKNGEAYLEWQTIMAQRDHQGNVVRYLSIFHDITDVRRTEQQVEYQANYDAMTGLPNRTLFLDRLSQAIEQAKQDKTMVAMVYLDIDNFKNINDSLGMPAGDKLLRHAANRLESIASASVTVARQGGDEFLIMAADIKHPRMAVEVARKINSVLSKPFHVDGSELFVTASMGMSFYPNDGADADTIMTNADTALHQAKLRDKNTYQVFEPRLNAMVTSRLDLENKLRRALEREEFIVHYQPKVQLATGRMMGMEALVRWQSETGKLVPPDMFIPLSEETGLIVGIGQWVLEEACRRTAAWRRTISPDLRVAVNISARQFQEVNLVALVQQTLRACQLPPEGLELEITESLVLHNLEYAVDVLSRLAAMGVHITMDDFGTGYSSLSYLKNLPLDTIKIDKSFITDITGDEDSAALADAIISMARSLRLKVIAEGVETPEQLAFLRERGCDQIQGYLYSRPVPEHDFELLLKSPPTL